MKTDAADLLRAHGIQPSAQRIVIARYVLFTDEHPSADKVLARVRAGFPMISRATVYNTLNLFVEKGLLREQHLAPDSIVFDPRTDAHHHFVDEASGRIYDIDWRKVRVSNVESIDGFEVQIIHRRLPVRQSQRNPVAKHPDPSHAERGARTVATNGNSRILGRVVAV